MNRRLRKLKETTIKKGFPVDIFPICFYLTDFDSDFCDVKQNDNEINITVMSLILKFLRLFGNEVKYVVCDFFGATEEQALVVFSNVNQNCISLNRLAFGNLNYDLEFALKKSFENITYVFFQRCILFERLCQLKTYFPNVREIIFSEENRFESLDKLIISYGFLTIQQKQQQKKKKRNFC